VGTGVGRRRPGRPGASVRPEPDAHEMTADTLVSRSERKIAQIVIYA
jgi:hypothetical protein